MIVNGLSIHLIAPFRVYVGNELVPDSAWQGRIPRSIVKRLALSPRGCTQDELIEEFWPNHPYEQARKNLYVAMSRVRHALNQRTVLGHDDPLPLVTTTNGYRLDDNTWVDIHDFHARVTRIRALRLSDPESALDLVLKEERIEPERVLADHPYDDWALAARERVFEDLRLLERTRAEMLLEKQHLPEALDGFMAFLKLDPTDEAVAAQAMHLAMRLNEQSRAIKIFTRLREALADDYGVQPSARMLQLYDDLIAKRRAPSPEKSYWEPPKLLGNPPTFLTRFVGREHVMAGVKSALKTVRLLTLHGPGGVGKTRLALETVKVLDEHYAYGVWWVDLATITGGNLLASTVAAALEITERQDLSLVDSICQALAPFTFLLVLDNCEHVLPEVTEFTQKILGACPGATVLTTSRTVLQVQGEHVYDVPPMAVPASEWGACVETLLEYEAVNLFVDRARAVRSGFKLTAANAKSVARICRRLDGIPLAIELAAARLVTLTPSQVADRLDQRFQLLRFQRSDGERRHVSLKSLIDGSFNILPEHKRRLWERLSVFSGSVSTETVEFIGTGIGTVIEEDGIDLAEMSGGEVLDALTGLVNRSIVMTEETDDGMRYRLLESMRAYGLSKLREGPDEQVARKKHTEWCLTVVKQANAGGSDRDENGAMQRLTTEYAEIRTVLDHSLEAGDIETAAKLTTSLWWFWIVNGWAHEGAQFVTRTLEAGTIQEGSQYAMLLHAAAGLHLYIGHVEAAAAYLAKCLEVISKSGTINQLVRVKLTLSQEKLSEGDPEGALVAIREGYAAFSNEMFQPE